MHGLVVDKDLSSDDDDDDDDDDDFERDREVEVDTDDDDRGLTLKSRAIAGSLRDDEITFSVRADSTGIQVRFSYQPDDDDDDDVRLRYRLFATDLVEFNDANANGVLDASDTIINRLALSTSIDLIIYGC